MIRERKGERKVYMSTRLENRGAWVRIPPGAAHFFEEKVSRLRWRCCVALLCIE